ncbi:hypothetical protein ACQ4LE_007370 [Meloidogyne hapla]
MKLIQFCIILYLILTLNTVLSEIWNLNEIISERFKRNCVISYGAMGADRIPGSLSYKMEQANPYTPPKKKKKKKSNKSDDKSTK